MLVCSESSFVRNDVHPFIQDSTIMFQWSVATLFQYTFVETFTAKFKFIKGDFIAIVCLITQPLHLRTSGLFFQEAWLSLIMLFVFTQHVRRKKVVTASAVKLSPQSLDRNLCHFAMISNLIQASSSFSA